MPVLKRGPRVACAASRSARPRAVGPAAGWRRPHRLRRSSGTAAATGATSLAPAAELAQQASREALGPGGRSACAACRPGARSINSTPIIRPRPRTEHARAREEVEVPLALDAEDLTASRAGDRERQASRIRARVGLALYLSRQQLGGRDNRAGGDRLGCVHDAKINKALEATPQRACDTFFGPRERRLSASARARPAPAAVEPSDAWSSELGAWSLERGWPAWAQATGHWTAVAAAASGRSRLSRVGQARLAVVAAVLCVCARSCVCPKSEEALQGCCDMLKQPRVLRPIASVSVRLVALSRAPRNEH